MQQDTQQDARATHPWITEGENTIRFGVVANVYQGIKNIVRFAQSAESLGYDSFWMSDHPQWGIPDCWSTLNTLATATTRIRLGSAVSCVYYRHPLVLARQAADVDILSNGRLVLGLGIGDDEAEFHKMGIPFPPARERQRVLEETLQILHGLWHTPSPFTYQGQYFQLHETIGRPLPVQQPHVPIMIAGGGERVTLRQVAQYADMCNFGPHEWVGKAFSLPDVQRKYEVLAHHCSTFARPYTSILRSHITPLILMSATEQALEEKFVQRPAFNRIRSETLLGTPETLIPHYQSLVDAGARYFIFIIPAGDSDTLHLLAEEVLPALQIPPQKA